MHWNTLYYTSHTILHKHWWFWMNCRENMCFPEKCRTHPGIKYWMYRMPNRSLNKRKISDSPPFVGMRAGAAAGSWIEDYSLGIDSTILGTSNPPLIFKQFLCHGNSIFFWTSPSDMWGDAISDFKFFSDRATLDLDFQHLNWIFQLPWSKVAKCLLLLYCALKLFLIIKRDLIKLLYLKTSCRWWRPYAGVMIDDTTWCWILCACWY